MQARKGQEYRADIKHTAEVSLIRAHLFTRFPIAACEKIPSFDRARVNPFHHRNVHPPPFSSPFPPPPPPPPFFFSSSSSSSSSFFSARASLCITRRHKGLLDVQRLFLRLA